MHTIRINRILVATIVLVVMVVFAGGCSGEPRAPDGAMKVSELAENPVYETDVTLFGEVNYLREVDCDCFDLTSGQISLKIWYDSMVEDDDTVRPAVNVDDIENGDWVLVTGVLKTESPNRPRDAFWATSIEKSR